MNDGSSQVGKRKYSFVEEKFHVYETALGEGMSKELFLSYKRHAIYILVPSYAHSTVHHPP
jgi:hypothetical protein